MSYHNFTTIYLVIFIFWLLSLLLHTDNLSCLTSILSTSSREQIKRKHRESAPLTVGWVVTVEYVISLPKSFIWNVWPISSAFPQNCNLETLFPWCHYDMFYSKDLVPDIKCKIRELLVCTWKGNDETIKLMVFPRGIMSHQHLGGSTCNIDHNHYIVSI